MRLRIRLQEELQQRFTKIMPEAIQTAWDHQAVVVVFEQMRAKSAGGYNNYWELLAQCSGVVQAELRANELDSLPMEELFANLIRDPVHLNFEFSESNDSEAVQSESARFQLTEWRDAVRDEQVVIVLRFSMEAWLARYAIKPTVPLEVPGVNHA